MPTVIYRVTIVIPCFNKEHFIRETLESVAKQTHSNWDCIIVDDGSTDESSKIVQSFQECDTRFRMIKQSNSGLSAARNTGIKQAKTELIVPLDADDLLQPTYLAETLSALTDKNTETRELTIVTTGVSCFGIENKIHTPSCVNLQTLLEENQIVCTALFSKSLWENIGQYDENMKLGYEDWDFWIRAAVYGAKFQVVSDPLFCYRQHENSMISNARLYRPQTVRYILEKHPTLFGELQINSIVGRENAILNMQRMWLNARSELRIQQRLTAQLQTEHAALATELLSYKTSNAYKIGRYLLSPIKFLRKAFSTKSRHPSQGAPQAHS